ncbi:MAG: SIMPL domain-containing protein [Balneola sp.]
MKKTSTRFSKGISLISAILFLTIALNCTTTAQSVIENSQRTISINMSATELIPADLIIFSININSEEKTPETAYDTHKNREAVLASLLKEFDIKEENINFEPIRMNKRTNYNNRQEEVTVNTNQQVSVSFSDFEIYEKIQVSLIENGFDSFNGSFSSSELEDGKDKALVSAIQKAKERAAFIAEQSGVKLGEITTINYSEHQVDYPPMFMEANRGLFKSDAPSMMDFAQTVSVTANISINFEIME